MAAQIMFKFGIGEKVVDSVTGFAGTVTGLIVWRDGSKGAAVTSSVGVISASTPGAAPATEWINEAFLQLVN